MKRRKTRAPRIPLKERFEAKFKRGQIDDCWLWLGAKHQDGYGQITICTETFKRSIGAHRISYELYVGPVPPAIMVCHTCDNPPCVNPSHLFLGTHQDNTDDMYSKGRGVNGSRNGRAKIMADDVAFIRANHVRGARTKNPNSTSNLAKKFGVSRSTIHFVLKRKTWDTIK